MDARGYVTSPEMRKALHRIYQEDGETNLHKALLNALSDNHRPVDDRGRRPNTLIVLLSTLLLALLGIFLYFSIGVRR